MSCTYIFRLLLTSTAFAASTIAIGDSIERHDAEATRPGEMEYIEVIGERDDTDVEGEKVQRARELKQRLLRRNRQEQVQSLGQRQRQLLEGFRADKEKSLAAERERRRQLSPEAARAEELQRQ
ncbi:hypothetical protein [Microbulbifer magnicolonia]|uniref:hypothetical protein n=1 Tax=Microbulbifer magnicolonia TaxID=3109744 RepID=UPI002B40CDC7|nr:hypothetical protein [Microbulbifer sp. GG15]